MLNETNLTESCCLGQNLESLIIVAQWKETFINPLHHEMVAFHPKYIIQTTLLWPVELQLKVIGLARSLHVCESMFLFVAKFHKCVTRCV
jgi:hypothetical protein